VDSETLSPKALEIFSKLKPFYVQDSWGNPQWKEEGIIIDNGPYDLRKKTERQRLEQTQKQIIGFLMFLCAKKIMKDESTLIGLTSNHIPISVQRHLEILLILDELDFQIETMDFVDG